MTENFFKNRVVLITGGGRGIGAATAQLFANQGSCVVIASRTSIELENTAAAIKKMDPSCQVFFRCCDISQEKEVIDLFDWICTELDVVDLLINNAAILENKLILEMDILEWEKHLRVNLTGSFLCARQALIHMKGKPHSGASIINVSSLSGIQGIEKFPGMSAYVVSKFGVVGLTESLAVEAKPWGVRVNCVAPGAVDTTMLRQAAPHFKTDTLPMDVAKVILFLADGTRSGKMTGCVIQIPNWVD